MKNLPPKAVLFLDNSTSHFSEKPLTSDCGNITVYFFPPNTTVILQPLDQNIIKTLKQIYRKKLLFHLTSQSGDNLNNKLDDINLKDVTYLVTEAWNEVGNSIISSGFQQLTRIANLESIPIDIKECYVKSLISLYRHIVPDSNVEDEEKLQWASGANEIPVT